MLSWQLNSSAAMPISMTDHLKQTQKQWLHIEKGSETLRHVRDPTSFPFLCANDKAEGQLADLVFMNILMVHVPIHQQIKALSREITGSK